MLAYAACALSFALAMMFLIQDKMKTETFLATTSLFVACTYMGILTRFEKWGGLSLAAWDAENKHEIFIGAASPVMRSLFRAELLNYSTGPARRKGLPTICGNSHPECVQMPAP